MTIGRFSTLIRPGTEFKELRDVHDAVSLLALKEWYGDDWYLGIGSNIDNFNGHLINRQQLEQLAVEYTLLELMIQKFFNRHAIIEFLVRR